MTGDPGMTDLWRGLAPQVLGALVRRYGHFDTAEDAVSEALLAAARQWPSAGTPDDPKAWLITVASRRLTDLLRRDQARRHREVRAARQSAVGPTEPSTSDDSLVLLFLCCHPCLTPAAQIALTLRAVGGLSTAEIARAFLVPEATMTRRITRAKHRIRTAGARFGLPPDGQRTERLDTVRHVLYLIFNEGYAATTGPLLRTDLTAEAIRLCRMLYWLQPDDSETTGLLALMLLTDARRAARATPDGQPIPMSEQDRDRWDADAIAEGLDLVRRALPSGQTGQYQVQAAIAALHDEAGDTESTDWEQIVALYELLLRIADNPVVALNHAVAASMMDGPEAGLSLLEPLSRDPRLINDHRLYAVRAQLHERRGDPAAAHADYEIAATKTTSIPRRRYLLTRADALNDSRQPDGYGQPEARTRGHGAAQPMARRGELTKPPTDGTGHPPGLRPGAEASA